MPTSANSTAELRAVRRDGERRFATGRAPTAGPRSRRPTPKPAKADMTVSSSSRKRIGILDVALFHRPSGAYPAPQQNCYESPCAGAPNPAKQRAGVGGAMRPPMIIFGFRFGSARLSEGATGESGGWAGGLGGPPSRLVRPCPVRDCRRARLLFSEETPLNSHPRRGRSGGLHRRGRPSFRPAARFGPEGACGSNHLSGGGLQARLRGQAQVVAIGRR